MEVLRTSLDLNKLLDRGDSRIQGPLGRSSHLVSG